jgi:hypothetical protein
VPKLNKMHKTRIGDNGIKRLNPEKYITLTELKLAVNQTSLFFLSSSSFFPLNISELSYSN